MENHIDLEHLLDASSQPSVPFPPVPCCARTRTGIVLLVVLFLVLILGMVILQFGIMVQYEKNIAQNSSDSLEASYIIQSKLEKAKTAILNMAGQASSAESGKAETPERENAITDTVLSGVVITDASNRININHIVNAKDKVNRDVMEAVENLFAQIGIEPNISVRIIDCIDRNNKPYDTKAKGSENGSLNRPFQNLTELGIIEDIPPELLQKNRKDGKPVLDDFLTVFSRGRININTAPPEVLNAIIKNRTYEKAVSGIIEQRQIKPFKSVQEIYEVPDVSRGIFFGYFENRLTTVPSVFIVDVEVQAGKITSRARAVFEKRAKTAYMLYFRKE